VLQAVEGSPMNDRDGIYPHTKQYSSNSFLNVGFDVLAVVVMKISVFWDITLCSLLLATCFHASFLLGLFSDTEDGGDIFLRNVS
jgi:hypothetical protein